MKKTTDNNISKNIHVGFAFFIAAITLFLASAPAFADSEIPPPPPLDISKPPVISQEETERRRLPSNAVLLDDGILEMHTITFEEKITMGFFATGGHKLVTSMREAFTGSVSLHVSGRKKGSDGPTFRLTNFVAKNTEYECNFWLKSDSTAATTFYVTLLFGEDEKMAAHRIAHRSVKRTDGWTQIKAHFFFNAARYDLSDIHIKIETDNKNAGVSYFIDDFYFGKPIQTAEMLKSSKLTALKEVYRRQFQIGAVFNETNINGYNLPLVQQHFGVLSAKDIMLPAYLSRSSGRYSFAETDRLTDKMLEERFTIHAGALVTPVRHAWLHGASVLNPTGREAAAANLTQYIETVAEHFAGRVDSWDVVTDAFLDITKQSPWKDALKKTAVDGGFWYAAFAKDANVNLGQSGADYIEAAFRAAREADPKATLYYADTGGHNPHRTAAVVDMVKEINAAWQKAGNERLLIEGVSFEGMFDLETDVLDVEQTIRAISALGVQIAITDLSVALPPQAGKPPQEMLDRQARVYAVMFRLFKKYSRNIARVSFAGFYDGEATEPHTAPFLFDESFNPKPAYHAILNPEEYLRKTGG